MAQRIGKAAGGGRERLLALWLAAALLAASTAACSEVPDWVNPGSWYRGVVGSDSDASEEAGALPPPGGDAGTAQAEETEAPVPGADEPFPNLASVPDTPPATTTPEAAERLVSGLIADRENARYTDEVLRGETEAAISSLYQPPVPLEGTAAATPGAEELAQVEAPVSEPWPVQPAAAEPLEPPAASELATSLPAIPSTTPSAEPQAAAPSGSAISSQPLAEPGRVASTEEFRNKFNKTFESSGPQTFNPQAYASAGGPAGDLSAFSAEAESYGSVSFLAAVVYFVSGGADLTADARAVLQDIAQLHRRTGGVVRVVGHASQLTREMPEPEARQLNFDLSAKRARTVAETLVALGVPPERIAAVAAGDLQPTAAEDRPQGEAENRRAEIFIQY